MTPAERVWERLWSALDDPFGRRRVYVYRASSGRKGRTSYIWKGFAWPGVPEMLRDDFDGGDFRVLIREGRRMVFSGNISVAPFCPNSLGRHTRGRQGSPCQGRGAVTVHLGHNQRRQPMKIRIADGQVYEHESGEEYEVLNVTDTRVEFKTSEGVFVRMDLDDFADDIGRGALALQEDDEE